jgi:hypothetical protein
MKNIFDSWSLSEPTVSPVTTGVQTTGPRSGKTDDETRECWRRVIDRQLLDWSRDPSRFEEEGIEIPSTAVIALAVRLAERLEQLGSPAPNRVCPDGDGGIAFERGEGPDLQSFRIYPDCSIELITLNDGRVRSREMIQL